LGDVQRAKDVATEPDGSRVLMRGEHSRF
ncbi:MAG: hypothetical protein QOI75_4221, partial [Pseudonocardiales bacterium]|nr:hypothetical protein [Pseudonocardiales bacterium]